MMTRNQEPRSAWLAAPCVRRWAVAAVAVGAVALVIAGCGRSSQLQQLRSDPVADLQLKTAERVRVVELEAGKTLGKPEPAVRQLVFRPSKGASFDDVLAEAVAAAEASGWSLAPRASGTAYRGERGDPGHLTKLEIYLEPSSGNVIVHLERF